MKTLSLNSGGQPPEAKQIVVTDKLRAGVLLGVLLSASLAPMPLLGQACPTTDLVIEASGTFDVPSGCNFMEIRAWANGGNAGWIEDSTYAGADGGGGAAFLGSTPVVPSTRYKVGVFTNLQNVGAGGRAVMIDQCSDPSCTTDTTTGLTRILALGAGSGGGFVRRAGTIAYAGRGGAGGPSGQDGERARVTSGGNTYDCTPGGGALPGSPGHGVAPEGLCGFAGTIGCPPDGTTYCPLDVLGHVNGGHTLGGGSQAGSGQYGGGGGAGSNLWAFAGGGGGSSWSSFGAVVGGTWREPGRALDPRRIGAAVGKACSESHGAGCGGRASVSVEGGKGRVVVRFSGVPFAGKGDLGGTGACSGTAPCQGDGLADLVIRHESSWEHRFWLMNGTSRLTELALSTQPANTLDLSGVDDFSGDGKQDLAFASLAPGLPDCQAPTGLCPNGNVDFWLMNGTSYVSTASMTPPAGGLLPHPWKLSATGDFNHDGKPDLVWRNTISDPNSTDPDKQKLRIWTMNGTAYQGTIIPSPDQAANHNWEIVGAVDVDNNGTTDLLWYNWSSGKVVQWLMDPNVVRTAGRFTIPDSAGNANWKVLAVGDYGVGSGGVVGSNDLVWRNATSGKFVVWHMDFAGSRTSGVFTVPDAPSPDPTAWTIVGPR